MGKDEIPIDTFDSLLRDLVTWNLVVHLDRDDGQSWQLVDRAQKRLGDLEIVQGTWPAERTAYSSRRCARCHRRQLTWLRDGSYVCDPCWQEGLAPVQDEPLVIDSSAGSGSRWVRQLRQRIAFMG
jgi:hypothetical protein